MDLQYLRRLVKIFDDSDATELSIEEEGVNLKISKNKPEVDSSACAQHIIHMPQAAPYYQAPAAAPPPPAPAPAAEPAQAPAEEKPSAEPADPAEGMHTIHSPIVGTFYRAPSPDSGPFVETGSRVAPGDTLCIVEAMKLMNEIESDVAGTVEKILIENGLPVEYNQPMFLIKPD